MSIENGQNEKLQARIDELESQIQRINMRHIKTELDRALGKYSVDEGVRELIVDNYSDRFEFDEDGNPVSFTPKEGDVIRLFPSDNLIPVLSHLQTKFKKAFAFDGGSEKTEKAGGSAFSGRDLSKVSDSELGKMASKL